MAEENAGRETPKAESQTNGAASNGASTEELSRLLVLMERMRLGEYFSALQNPRRVIMINFLAGLARGLGIGIGMTFLLGAIFYVIHLLIDLPLVGAWIAKIVTVVQEELKNGL